MAAFDRVAVLVSELLGSVDLDEFAERLFALATNDSIELRRPVPVLT